VRFVQQDELFRNGARLGREHVPRIFRILAAVPESGEPAFSRDNGGIPGEKGGIVLRFFKNISDEGCKESKFLPRVHFKFLFRILPHFVPGKKCASSPHEEDWNNRQQQNSCPD